MNGAGSSTPGSPPRRSVRSRRERETSPPTVAAEPSRTETLASLGALAGDLAHEIRNPLVALKSFLDLLPERCEDPEIETRFLEVAREELRRAERLLDAMIDARRAGGRRDPPGDVAKAVDAMAMLLGPRARTRGVRITSRVEAGLPDVALGADALRQVLLNLLYNAVDASPRDGRVDVAARHARGGVEISVSDEGPGLPPAGRAGERIARRPGGLGLSITRRLVADAGGSLVARNAPGGGALVRVWSPAAPGSR